MSLPTLPSSICNIMRGGSQCTILSVNESSQNTCTLNECHPCVLRRGSCRVICITGFTQPLAPSTRSVLRIVTRVRTTYKVGFATVMGGAGLTNSAATSCISRSLSGTRRLSELANLPVLFASMVRKVSVRNAFGLGLRGGCFSVV